MGTCLEKEILKTQYEIMIRGALEKQTIGTAPYKKFLSFLGSFIISAFFTWCSSGDSSYLPILFYSNEKVRYFICFLPFLVVVFFDILVGVSIPLIFKEVDSRFDMTRPAWRRCLISYLALLLDKEYKLIQKDKSIIREELKMFGEVYIDEVDFGKCLREYYKKYKLNVYEDFYMHLVKMILLDNENMGVVYRNNNKSTFRINHVSEPFIMAEIQRLSSDDYLNIKID